VKERGVGEYAVELLSGRSSLRKSCCHTSQPLWLRAISAKCAAPSHPIVMGAVECINLRLDDGNFLNDLDLGCQPPGS
jgi:hypothetical protein